MKILWPIFRGGRGEPGKSLVKTRDELGDLFAVRLVRLSMLVHQKLFFLICLLVEQQPVTGVDTYRHEIQAHNDPNKRDT